MQTMNRALGVRTALVSAVWLVAPVALGCTVQTPVVSTEEALETLSTCLYCPLPTDPDDFIDPEPRVAYVDTLVVTTFRLEAEIDCRSCIEENECEVEARDCVCLDATEPLEDLDIEAALAGLAIPNLSRQEQYCIAIAAVLAETAPGEECACAPETWELPRGASRSCTYSRRAKSPSDDQLVLSTTLCQSVQLEEPMPPPGFTPPAMEDGGMGTEIDGGPAPDVDGGVGPPAAEACIEADSLADVLSRCAGLSP